MKIKNISKAVLINRFKIAATLDSAWSNATREMKIKEFSIA